MTIDTDPCGAVAPVRVLAFNAAPLPTPEIRALARIDVAMCRDASAYCTPDVWRFATLAEEPTEAASPCTPLNLARAVWGWSRPAALVAWGAATWDLFGVAFTCAIPRIDMCKIARLLWSDDDARSPVRLARRMGFLPLPTELEGGVVRDTAEAAQAFADLFCIVVTGAGNDIIRRAAVLDALHPRSSPGRQVHAMLGALRGDARLEALICLSAAPMPPLGDLPGPWDDEAIWFAMSGEDLRWYANTLPGMERHDSYAQGEARAELARRAAHELDLLRPRHLSR